MTNIRPLMLSESEVTDYIQISDPTDSIFLC